MEKRTTLGKRLLWLCILLYVCGGLIFVTIGAAIMAVGKFGLIGLAIISPALITIPIFILVKDYLKSLDKDGTENED